MDKTIRASVIGLTKIKKELLDNDYFNYQWYMIFGIDKGLLSCFKAHKGFKQKVIKYREYPLPLWSTLIKNWFRVKNTKLTKTWIKIPNSKKKGIGVWLPLKFHQEFPKNYKLKDSYLLRKDNKYYIHFCIEVLEAKQHIPENVLGIDLGLKNPITMINIKTKKTYFLGKELKRIRGKYFYLRRKLGKNKNLKLIRKIKNKEKNKVNNLLHRLSKEIVNKALKEKSAIIIGKLKDFKKNKGRKLSSFTYYQLYQYIEYKSKEKGIPLVLVNERYTSKTCNVCGSIGKRTKNWFKCDCGHEDNADRNAAFNIGKRGLSYMLESGVEASALKSLAKSINIPKGCGEETSTIKMQNCASAQIMCKAV